MPVEAQYSSVLSGSVHASKDEEERERLCALLRDEAGFGCILSFSFRHFTGRATRCYPLPATLDRPRPALGGCTPSAGGGGGLVCPPATRRAAIRHSTGPLSLQPMHDARGAGSRSMDHKRARWRPQQVCQCGQARTWTACTAAQPCRRARRCTSLSSCCSTNTVRLSTCRSYTTACSAWRRRCWPASALPSPAPPLAAAADA